MKNIKAIHCATLAILATVGCSAGHDDAWNDENAADVASNAPAAVENESDGADKELARLEFEDGNVVRFEALHDGVLVSEMGADLNPRRLVPREGMTALDAFRALAPGRAVPVRLLQMHVQMYSGGNAITAERNESDPAATESDPDLEHDGDFQQALPASAFLSVMCDFPTGNGSYKHSNRTDAHTDASLDVHSAYFAVGSDSGTVTTQACVGENTGGFFDGDCGGTTAVPAGFQTSAFYDAGPDQICDGGDGFGCELFGCVEVCYRPLVRFELNYGKISPSVNFHECVQVTH
ncbi:MAG: hypothetical protein ABW217_09400 [Polyangiaceae bacterium]